MDLVVLQRWVAVCLDPHARHSVVKDLVVLYHPETSVVDEYTSVLSAPDLIALDEGVTTSPRDKAGEKIIRWFKKLFVYDVCSGIMIPYETLGQ